MEQLIQRLIEVDKQARARVNKAKKERAGALELIEARRSEIEAQNAKAFEARILEEQQLAAAQKEAAKVEIEQSKQAMLAHLDSLFAQNGDAWVERIVAGVLDG